MSPVAAIVLIAVILLVFLIVPILISVWRSDRKRHHLLADCLHAAAESNGLHLAHFEGVGNRIIGLDKQQHKVLFLDDIHYPVYIIDLHQIDGCQVLKTRSFRTVQTISLHLFDFQGKLTYELLFYRQFVDNELKLKRFERQSRKWEALVNDPGNED